MDVRTTIIYGLIGVIIGMLLVIFMGKECNTMIKEGFQEKPAIQPRICPRGTVSYTDKAGNLNCCRGQVNGNFCEGVVHCTFSSSAQNMYKLCGAGRRRKFFGQINDFVKMYMNTEFIVKFEQIVNIMEQFKPRVRAMVPSMITEQAFSEYEGLVKEEKDWLSEVRYSGEDSQVYQEEVMYILQRLQSIFADQKIAKNPQVVQQEIIMEACKKQVGAR
jgi:hypothetical protein